ncbi:MAG: protein kinase [Planctomycetes bacterium]|nr:protein kinase [Planctomycetota bacterium]MCB9917646.1 protein kinase [Planctomycetota bacterium]
MQSLLADRARGIDLGVEDYVARFEGHEALIRREYAELSAADLPEGTTGVDGAPRRVGPYHVRERIGSGGMGDVFLAEQLEPLQRLVAVKIIKLGMDTREVIARFDAERQALALMDHPNIARVYEAGSTDEGRPYFAMEYIRGCPITEFCEREHLDLDGRLDLFLAVCDGVQHAHQRGVIHRDLKPSNILVAIDDDQPVAKVIDFGIAKATDVRLGPNTLHTMEGRILGTPEYMSPEQADIERADIDTRSDVYSLGCLLYELLTGAPPFRRESAHDYESVLRALRQEDVRAPSTRVAGKLSRDLDWITLEALSKDRELRYASVADFAADLRRYRRDEPVEAGPPSTSYRLRKFVRRHRPYVVGASLAVGMLVAGLVVSMVFWTKSVASASEERSARRLADLGFRKAQEAVDKMLAHVGAEDLRHVPHMEQVRRDLLEEALGFHKDFLSLRGDDPTVRFAAARAYRQSGTIHSLLGDDESARCSYLRAEELLGLILDPEASEMQRALYEEYALLHYRHGDLERKLGNLAEARSRYEASARFVDDLIRAHPDVVEYALRRADLEMEYGDAEGALERVSALADREPPVARAAQRMLVYLETLGRTALSRGKVADAKRFYERGLRRAEHDDRSWTLDSRKLAQIWAGLAIALQLEGSLNAADEAAEHASTRYEALLAAYPSTPSLRSEMAKLHGTRSLIAEARGDSEAQKEHVAAAVAVLDALVLAYPWVPDYRRTLGIELANLANVISKSRSLHSASLLLDARKHVDRAAALLEGLDAWMPLAFARLVGSEVCRLQGDAIAADANLQAAAEAYEHIDEATANSMVLRRATVTWIKWAEVLLARDASDKARDVLVRSLRCLDRLETMPAQTKFVATPRFHAFKNLARAYQALGQDADALRVVRRSSAALPDDWRPQQLAAEVCLAAARKDSDEERSRALLVESSAFAKRACEHLENETAVDVARCQSLYADLLLELGQTREALDPLVATLRAWRSAVTERTEVDALAEMRETFSRMASALVTLGESARLARAARSFAKWLGEDPEALFVAACAYSTAAELAKRAESAEWEQHGADAARCLQSALDAGLPEARVSDPRFDVLRDRPEFRALLRSSEKR